MAKKPKRGASRGPVRKKTPQRQVPGWVWLFSGLMIGLFVMFLFQLGQTQKEQGTRNLTVTPEKAEKPKPKPKPAPSKDESKDDSPQFDFYAVLPQMEVIVPQTESDTDSQSSKPPSASKPSTTSKPPATKSDDSSTRTSNEKYLLQAGSFRRNSDADRRRAELILKGFDASIQAATLSNGDSWYRVMIGPYDNLNAMHRAQDQLSSNGIETLPIKMKK